MHALMKHALDPEVRDRLARELGLQRAEAPAVSRRFPLDFLFRTAPQNCKR